MHSHRIFGAQFSISDATDQLNANFIFDLPFGHGRHWGGGANRFVNNVFGGWTVSGRWTSGFPFSVFAGNGWSTNFELNGTSFVQGPKPKTGVFRDQDGDPNVFQNAVNLTCTCFAADGFDKPFRATYAGEAGQRNNFRCRLFRDRCWTRQDLELQRREAGKVLMGALM